MTDPIRKINTLIPCVPQWTCQPGMDHSLKIEFFILIVNLDVRSRWPNHFTRIGKQYLWKKNCTKLQQWNLGPTPIRGELATTIVSVNFGRDAGHIFSTIQEKNVQDNFSYRRPLPLSCGALAQRSYDTVAAVTPLLYWLLQLHWLLGVFLSSTSEPVLWDY